MKLKYVVIDECLPITFGEYFQHKKFSNIGKITSAGFYNMRIVNKPDAICPEYTEVTCFGESIGLGIKSRPIEDKALLERLYNES